MKPILTLLALAAVGLALVGCDPAPKDDPNAPAVDTRTKTATSPTKGEVAKPAP